MASLNVEASISYDVTAIIDWAKRVETFIHRANNGLPYEKQKQQALNATKEEISEFATAYTRDYILDAICDLFVTTYQLIPEDYCLAHLPRKIPLDSNSSTVWEIKESAAPVLQFFFRQNRFLDLFKEVVILAVKADRAADGGLSSYMEKVLDNNDKKILKVKPTDEDTQAVIDKYAAKGVKDIVVTTVFTDDFGQEYVYRADNGSGKILKPNGFVDLLAGTV